MNYNIDWLTLTLKPEKDNVTYSNLHIKGDMCPLENWCFQFLELSDLKDSFKKKQGSIQHYNTMYHYNGISIALSTSSRFPEQGLMFRFSADGIAFYERFMRERHSEWSWITFLKEFFSLGVFGLTCKCTRIDLAFDDISYNDRDRLIDLKIVSKALRNGEFVSSFRATDSKTPFKLISAYEDIKRNTKGSVLGETYYVGNRKSKVFLRFYDKLLECQAKNEPYDDKITHWTRMEFEFKDVRAMTVCDSLIMLSPDEFGIYMSKVTNHYIRFVVPKGTRENYYRCSSRKWWNKVVGTVEKAKLVENKAYKNRFNSTMRWLKKQVFPTLFAVLHCIKVDELISDVRETGLNRMSSGSASNFDMILKDYFNNTDSEKYKGIEVHKASYDDYEKLLAEFDNAAYSAKMRLKVLGLCDALSLTDEKKKLYARYEELIQQHRVLHKPHRAVVNGMYDKNIMEFQSEKQIMSDFPFPLYG